MIEPVVFRNFWSKPHVNQLVTYGYNCSDVQSGPGHLTINIMFSETNCYSWFKFYRNYFIILLTTYKKLKSIRFLK